MSATPDYSQYSLPELYQALNGVLAERYPATFAALEKALEERTPQSRMELIDCYYHLDKVKWPLHAQRLRGQIDDLGGFEAAVTEVISDEKKYRTFWRRFWAQIIDSLLLAVPTLILMMALVGQMENKELFNAYAGEFFQYVFFFYFIFMHGRFGQTVGKMVVGVKVVDVSEERAIGFRQAFLRDAVPLLLALVSTAYLFLFGSRYDEGGLTGMSAVVVNAVALLASAWTLTELVTMLFNRKRRAAHDFIARTVVVRIP